MIRLEIGSTVGLLDEATDSDIIERGSPFGAREGWRMPTSP